MTLTLIADGSPTSTDLLTGYGTVAMAVVALAAMVVSIVFAFRSERSARAAVEVQEEIRHDTGRMADTFEAPENRRGRSQGPMAPTDCEIYPIRGSTTCVWKAPSRYRNMRDQKW